MNRLVLALLLVFMMLSFKASFSQERLPVMHVLKGVSEARIRNFSNGVNNKYERLKSLNGTQDKALVYSKSAINILISKIPPRPEIGLRVYFARYDKTIGTGIPATVEDKKVILLFSYSYLDVKIPDAKFYFIDIQDPSDPVKEITNKKAIDRWIKNYNTVCQDRLRSGLIRNDRDNIDHTETTNIKYDTKSIFYDRVNLIEATTLEETYRHLLRGAPIFITGYQFSFSAHNSLGSPHPPQRGRWKNRMQLDIDYVYNKDGITTVFHLDDLDDFADRSRKTVELYFDSLNPKKQKLFAPNGIKELSPSQIDKLLSVKSIDNGQLCPTNCPK